MVTEPSDSSLEQDWQLTWTHPRMSGKVSLSPLRAAMPNEAGTNPLQFGVSLTSDHPLLNEFLSALGPFVIHLLPIILAALLAGKNPSPTPPSPSV